MDFYQKIKRKIAEEFEADEDEDVVGPDDRLDDDELAAAGGSGSDSETVLKLRQEIRTLRSHINNNYNVYVKRLDKRKARIKELEEYTKLVVKDNETLTSKLQDAEGNSIANFCRTKAELFTFRISQTVDGGS